METTVLSVPCLTLRDNTEHPETVTNGTNELIGTDPSKLPPALARLMAGSGKKARSLRNGTARQRSGSWSIWNDCWKVNELVTPKWSIGTTGLVEILRADEKGAVITRGIAIALKRIRLSKPTMGEMVRLLSEIS